MSEENIFKGEMMPQMGSVQHKKVADKDAAWEVQEQYKGQPHGWVQWKGTEVCMDIHCKCGDMFHIDASFAYFVKCPTCETVYMCNGHIELIEIDKEPDSCVVMPD
jgi:hypothetical protein